MQKFLRTLMLVALMLPFASHAQTMYLTVADSTATNNYVPVYGLYVDDFVRCQTVYPASMLADMENETILGVTYYLSSPAAASWGAANFVVNVMEVADATLSAFVDMTNATTVYTGALDATQPTMEIEFTVPYTYQGGNLLVEIYNTLEGTYKSAYFYGVNATGASWQGNNGTSVDNITGSARDFIPKTTFMYGEAPTCFKVSNLAIDATLTTTNSLTLTWTDALNTGATYGVYAVTATDTTLLADGISTTSYTVSDLEGNTSYSFVVKTDCGGEETGYTNPVTGRTACAAISTLPYTCGFEENEIAGTANALAFPYCWTRINTLESGTYTYYPYAYSYGSPHDGNRHLYFYASSYGTYADTTGFILPELDVNTYPMNGNRLSFWARVTSSTPYTVYVGTMTDPTDANTFTLVDSVIVSNTTYTKYAISLADANATDAYLAVIVPKVIATMYLDDLTLEEMPSCLEVPSVAVTGVTSSSISLTWTENSANASATYSVYTVTAAGTELVESGINDTTYTVEDLEANTQYTFAVQANCTSGDAPFTNVSGRTACASEALPYTENFDTWESKSPCWSFLSGAYNGGNGTPTEYASAWAVNNSYGTYITISGKALTMNVYSTNRFWAVTPNITMTSDDVLLTADVAVAAWSAATPNYDADDTLAFAISTDGGYSFTTLRVLDGTELNTLTNAFTTLYIPVSGYIDQDVRFAIFGGSSASGGDNRLVIDNVSVSESTGEICYPVTALTASNITSNGATLTWENDATDFNVYQVVDGDTVAVDLAVVDNTAEIEGLDANTTYTFGVATNCSSSESPIVFVSFTTLCDAYELPFNENFNTLTAGIPDCWSNAEGTTTTASYKWNYYATGNDGAGLRFNSYNNSNGNTNVLATPSITLSEQASLVFYYKNPTGGDFSVMVGIAGSEERTTLATGLTGVSTWTLANYSIPDNLLNEDIVVYFQGTSNYGSGDAYIYLDDVSIIAAGSMCLPVTDLAASNITSNSATLTWENDATDFNIYQVVDGDTVAVDLTAVDNTVEIEDLEANTSYTYGVAANCGSDESSIVFVTFRTACGAMALPFSETFDATLANDPCWNGANALYTDGMTLTMGANSNWTYSSSTSNGLEAGHYRVNIYGTNCTKWMITPSIDLSETSNPLLTFDAAFTKYSGTAVAEGFENNPTQAFMILVSTDNGQTWSTASNISLSAIASLTYIPQYVNLGAYAGETVRIAFYAQSTESGGDNNLHIDNILVEESTGEICYPVSDLAASNITTNSASISWTSDATDFNVYQVVDGDTVAVDLTPVDNTIELDELNANTSYTYGVSVNCSDNESSIMFVTFRTACGAMALPFSETFDVTLNNDPCWNGANVLYTDSMAFTMGANSNWTYSSSTSNGLEAGHYRVNIYGSSCTKWMITPMIDLSEATNPLLTFDAAFTKYSGTAVADGFENNPTQAFMILVSTNNGQTWSTASNISLSAIASLTYIPQYVDLSAYAGETVRIAFYAQSTQSGGDNNLHIDNILVEESTGEICYPVSDLTASDITTNSATLSWNSDATNFSVYQVVDGDTVALDLAVVDNTATLLGLEPMTSYTYGVAVNCSSNESSIRFVTFNTGCAAIDLPFTETFETTSGSISCWSVADIASNTGITNGTFRFYYSSNPPQYLVSPEFNASDDSVNVSFDYWVGMSSYPESFQLGYSTTTNDLTSFVWGVEQTNLTNTTVEQYNEVLPEGVKYVAIKYTSNDMYYLYIDNFAVTAVNDTTPVILDTVTVDIAVYDPNMGTTNPVPGTYQYVEGDVFSVTAIADDGYTFDHWTEFYFTFDSMGMVTNHDVTYTDETLSWPAEDLMGRYGLTYTAYFVEDTTPVPGCDPMVLPFTELFETNSATLPCWYQNNLDAGSGTNVNGYFQFHYGYEPQYLITPELVVSENNLNVSFDYWIQSANYPESFQLGYSTTTNEVTSFTWGNEQTNLTNTDVVRYSEVVPAGTKYVAIKYTAYDAYYLYIDSLTITELSGDYCFAPTNVTVDTVSANSVTISWDGNAANYNVYGIDAAGVATPMDIVVVNNQVTIGGLNAMTAYTFGVQAACSDDNLSDMVTVTAVTACEGATCEITLSTDSENGYGTWSSPTLVAAQNGIAIAEVNGEAETVEVCSNLPVVVLYVDPMYGYGTPMATVLDGGNTPIFDGSTVGFATGDTLASFLPCPSCMPVAELEATNVTTNSVTLSWTSDAASFDVYNGEVFVANVTTTNYTFTGLDAMTAYTFGVVANCTADDASNMASIDVITSCPGESCVITIYAQDTYGDGWTGNAITLVQNGIAVATYSMADQGVYSTPIYDTALISVCAEMPIEFHWTTGQYSEEASFTILNGNGVEVYSGSGAQSATFLTLDSCNAQGTVVVDTLTVTFAMTDTTMGTITPAAGTYQYFTGDTVTFSAVPNDGYQCDGWMIIYGEDTMTTSYTVAMGTVNGLIESFGNEITLIAMFRAPNYATVTFAVNDTTMGTTTPAPGTYQYAEDETIEFSAQANAGYRFAGWLLSYGENIDTIGADYISAYIDAATLMEYYGDTVTFTALFEAGNPDSIMITYSVNDPAMGSIMPTGSEYAYVGNYVTATATANDGYELENWTVNYWADDSLFYTDYGDEDTLNIYLFPNYVTEYGITQIDFIANFDEVVVPDTCMPVTGLDVTYVSSNNVVLNWDEADGFQMIYTLVGDTLAAYSDVFYLTNGVDIVNLTPATTYTFGVSTFCTDGQESEVSYITVTTLPEDTTYVPDTVTVTFNVNDATMGSITPEGVQQYAVGDILSVVATANEGYVLYGWQLTLDSLTATATENIQSVYTAVVTEDIDGLILTALFMADTTPVVPDSATITFAVNDASMGTTTPAPGTYTYADGATLTVSATAYTGYHLIGWHVYVPFFSLDTTLIGEGLGTYTDNVSYLMDGTVLTALFAADSTPVVDTTYYTLTVLYDTTMGNVIGAPTAPVAAGTVLSLTAVANDGYHFVSWSNGETTPTITVTVNTDMTLMANFEANAVGTYYTVTVTYDETMGTVTGVPTEPVEAGSTITLTASANEGYNFVGWSTGETTATISIVVNSDMNIIANFEAIVNYYTVTVNYDATMGTVVGVPEGPVAEGTQLNLTARANEGYHFVSWSNGQTDASITIVVNSNIELTATFEADVQGIDDVETVTYSVYSADSKVYVKGVENMNVYLFDVNGRILRSEARAAETVEFTVPSTGVYFVKVGNDPAKRVVVLR